MGVTLILLTIYCHLQIKKPLICSFDTAKCVFPQIDSLFIWQMLTVPITVVFKKRSVLISVDQVKLFACLNQFYFILFYFLHLKLH